MKTATLAATCLTMLFAASNVRADHRVYRTLDDLAFAALSNARDARWEVRDHFVTSRDFQPLLEDADGLMLALRAIQDAVYREDDPRRLFRLMESAHDALLHFQEHAEHSDFASTPHRSIRYRNRGYSYRGRTRNAGYAHVQELQQTLNELDSHLHEMDEVLEGAFGHDHHGGPYFEGTGPASPGGVVIPPAPGPSAEAVSIPLLGGRFRIRID
jgi:hypothetical protein